MKTILFVCTGNIFRSLSAEVSCRRYFEQKGINGWQTRSAGTRAGSQAIRSTVVQGLREIGLDPALHVPTLFTPQLVTTDTIVISMALNHRDCLRKEHSIESLLFNQVLGQSEDSILDVHEVLSPEQLLNSELQMEYIRSTIRRIDQSVPSLVDKIIRDNDRIHVIANRSASDGT